jgi:outer membrane murein-binding lipoprotein Lpp
MPVKNPLPFTFKEFTNEPVKAMLLLVALAVGYLYIDGKINYTGQIDKLTKKTEMLETKVDVLTNQLRKSDSTLAAATAKIGLLQELGKIK